VWQNYAKEVTGIGKQESVKQIKESQKPLLIKSMLSAAPKTEV
jgi:hypothetical protein